MAKSYMYKMFDRYSPRLHHLGYSLRIENNKHGGEVFTIYRDNKLVGVYREAREISWFAYIMGSIEGKWNHNLLKE